MILVLAMAPFKEYGLGAYGLVALCPFDNPLTTPFEKEVGLTGGLEGLACKSDGSADEFVLFNFPRPNPKAPFDFCFVRFLGVEGEGGFVVTVAVVEVGARAAPEETDWASVIEPAGVISAEVCSVMVSGRGGGGDTLLRG